MQITKSVLYVVLGSNPSVCMLFSQGTMGPNYCKKRKIGWIEVGMAKFGALCFIVYSLCFYDILGTKIVAIGMAIP